MKCSEVEVLLTESLDEALLEEVRAHLSECPDCLRLLHEMEAMESLNFSLGRLAGAPVDFSQRVARRLNRRRWRRTIWTIAASVAIFSLGISGLFLTQPAQTQEARAVRITKEPGQVWQTPGVSQAVFFADPAASFDLERQYLEVILGEVSQGSDSALGVPSEIKVHRTDMGKVNLTHVSH